ncbi:hypothetical protein M5K25_003891 [Dendrobium thyrsiflorum]|uniref:Uncharacterized protein n=1 Tax=Dendrobium thyrsiflorum TaxID=117978 RepID=A0ABD0VKF2_DENTH
MASTEVEPSPQLQLRKPWHSVDNRPAKGVDIASEADSWLSERVVPRDKLESATVGIIDDAEAGWVGVAEAGAEIGG